VTQNIPRKISDDASFSLPLFVFVHVRPIFSVLLTHSLKINSLLVRPTLYMLETAAGSETSVKEKCTLGRICQPNLGPDLQNILRQSYDYLTIMPKLRSTYDTRDGTSNLHNVLRRTQRFSEARFTCKVVRSSETMYAN